jgi:hypothetical protein
MDIDSKGEPPRDVRDPSPTLTTFKSRSTRRLIPFSLVGIMTIGAGVAAFFAVRESTTPSEAVASALTNSLQFRSAATTTSIEVREPGGTATITSEGVTSFDSPDTTQAVQIVGDNERIGEQVISDGPKIYVHLDGGAIARIVAGKSWVSLPSGQSRQPSGY